MTSGNTRMLTNDLVHFLNEVGSWKFCELRGDIFKFVNRFLVDSFQFVHLLLYEHFGSTRQMFALLKKFSDKEVSDFLCIDSHLAVTVFLYKLHTVKYKLHIIKSGHIKIYIRERSLGSTVCRGFLESAHGSH